MVQIAADHYWTRLLEFQEQHLMVRRVSRSGLDHNASIAENIVVRLRDDQRLAVLERAVVGRLRSWRRRIAEHHVAFEFSDEPGGLREQVAVADVVPMEMRKRHILDICR